MSTNGRETRTYRGRNLAELLPQIREELGPDAVITRQRHGLKGGFAGFFQKQFVEVEAHAGDAAGPAPGRLVDVYDEGDDALPDTAATAEGMASPAIRALMKQAAPFAEQLEAAEQEQENAFTVDRSPLTEVDPDAERSTVIGERSTEPQAPIRRFKRSGPAQADAIEATLVDAGLSAELAGTIVSETVAHLLPFGNTRKLKRLVRGELARRIPVESTWAGAGRRIGFVGTGGAGKTLCAARIAAAYAAAGDRTVVCFAFRSRDGGAELSHLLRDTGVPLELVETADEAWERIARLDQDAIVVVDTPAVSVGEPDEVAALGSELGRFVHEVHLALPATTSTRAAEEVVAALEPLGISHLALTHLDATSHIGGAVELAMRNATALSFTGRGTGVAHGLEPADPHAIASLLLP